MNANVVTALAALLGSVAGASAAIATTWISQRSQTREIGNAQAGDALRRVHH